MGAEHLHERLAMGERFGHVYHVDDHTLVGGVEVVVVLFLPVGVLDGPGVAAHGVDVPHRTYLSDADNRVDRTTTAVITDSSGATVRVHLHQDVREDDDDDFGSFGAAEDDTDDVIWTVVGLDSGVVDLTVVGEWSRRRTIKYEKFAENYEPVYLNDGQPRFGY